MNFIDEIAGECYISRGVPSTTRPPLRQEADIGLAPNDQGLFGKSREKDGGERLFSFLRLVKPRVRERAANIGTKQTQFCSPPVLDRRSTMAETIQPICKACEQARANAKAAGHRGWANGACYDHAGTSFEALMARHTADDRSEIERLADAIVEASAP